MGGPAIRDPTPAWLKPENASVFDSYWTRIARLLGGVLGAADPASQVMGLMTTEIPTEKLSDVVKGIKAYHGSPHDFEKFSLEKIGTGEGAQAYGHGLYFAEKPEVAKQYRDALKWRGSNWDDPAVIAGNVLETNGGDRAAAIKQLEEANRRNVGFKASELGNQKRQQAIDLLSQGESISHSANPGRMYEVQIKADPEQFLDWDKPLSQQPPQVKEAANEMFRGRLKTRDVGPDLVDVYESGGGSLGVFPKDKVAEVLANPADYYPYKGKQLYQQLESERAVDRGAWKNPSEYASQELRQIHGIPGIKYLDQASRAAGEGSRNYVVFDDKLIDILRKYGVLPPVAGLTALSQLGQPRTEQR